MSTPQVLPRHLLDNPPATDFAAIADEVYIADASVPKTADNQEVLFLTADVLDTKRNAKDDALAVRFFRDATPDYAHYHKTREVIYVDADMIEIRIPHDPANKVVRVAQEADRVRFPKQWRAYKLGEKQVAEGTPLSALKFGPAELRNITQTGITTVEQLAASGKLAFLGGERAQAKAKEFLAKHSAQTPEVAAENEALKERLAALEAKLAALTEGPAKPIKKS